MATVHLLVKGRVQGVFFRASAREKAESLSISGWVKNTVEGDVEIMASGAPQALEDFINWCHHGPRQARVDEVIRSAAAPNDLTGFRIIH